LKNWSPKNAQKIINANITNILERLTNILEIGENATLRERTA
jgi:hypothetical protein